MIFFLCLVAPVVDRELLVAGLADWAGARALRDMIPSVAVDRIVRQAGRPVMHVSMMVFLPGCYVAFMRPLLVPTLAMSQGGRH